MKFFIKMYATIIVGVPVLWPVCEFVWGLNAALGKDAAAIGHNLSVIQQSGVLFVLFFR